MSNSTQVSFQNESTYILRTPNSGISPEDAFQITSDPVESVKLLNYDGFESEISFNNITSSNGYVALNVVAVNRTLDYCNAGSILINVPSISIDCDNLKDLNTSLNLLIYSQIIEPINPGITFKGGAWELLKDGFTSKESTFASTFTPFGEIYNSGGSRCILDMGNQTFFDQDSYIIRMKRIGVNQLCFYARDFQDWQFYFSLNTPQDKMTEGLRTSGKATNSYPNLTINQIIQSLSRKDKGWFGEGGFLFGFGYLVNSKGVYQSYPDLLDLDWGDLSNLTIAQKNIINLFETDALKSFSSLFPNSSNFDNEIAGIGFSKRLIISNQTPLAISSRYYYICSSRISINQTTSVSGPRNSPIRNDVIALAFSPQLKSQNSIISTVQISQFGNELEGSDTLFIIAGCTVNYDNQSSNVDIYMVDEWGNYVRSFPADSYYTNQLDTSIPLDLVYDSSASGGIVPNVWIDNILSWPLYVLEDLKITPLENKIIRFFNDGGFGLNAKINQGRIPNTPTYQCSSNGIISHFGRMFR